MVRTQEQGWLRLLPISQHPDLRVVCFPHSGGSAGTFGEWGEALPPGVQLVAIQYPGRADRFSEPPMDSAADMGAHAALGLLQLRPAPSVLFGHSLGALVAYEATLVLRDAGAQPRRLCVSGSPAPRFAGGGRTHLAPDEEFWASLCRLGGIDADIAGNIELRELLLPTLRSDVRASETYQPWLEATPLSCDVRCYQGAGDPLVDEAQLGAWAQVSSGPFTLRMRPGGHFHVRLDVAGLVADIVQGVLA
jgi:pyochelin biosynthesis protein PchC